MLKWMKMLKQKKLVGSVREGQRHRSFGHARVLSGHVTGTKQTGTDDWTVAACGRVMMMCEMSQAQQEEDIYIRGGGSYESLGLWEGVSRAFFACRAARRHGQRDRLTLTFWAVRAHIRCRLVYDNCATCWSMKTP